VLDRIAPRTLLAGALALAARPAAALARWRIAIIPKLVGIAYYDAVKTGVDAAARELPELAVTWSGPTQDQVGLQIDLVERLIPSRPDLIAIAPDDAAAIGPVLKKARAAGIHVLGWDADAPYREFFVNLVDYDAFGNRLVEALVAQAGPQGDIAIVTTNFTTANQARWVEAIERAIYARHPGLRIVDVRPAGESSEEAYRITQGYLDAYPSLKGLIVLGVPNLPGAARALRDARRAGQVALVGNSTPRLMREFLLDGTVRSVVLWNPRDHGYLTVYTARQLLAGGLRPGQAFQAGRLGAITPRADDVNAQVALPVLVITRDNVDRLGF
jgi:rhamnose transport system substrate-binding protein